MKLSLGTLLSFVLLISYSISTYGQNLFQESSFEDCKAKAHVDEKPFFVYVHAQWCLPCQIMNEGIFNDKNLEGILSEDFNNYKIDYNSDLGEEWKAEFGIVCLPTLMYFDKDGILQDRIESTMNSRELLGFLNIESQNESLLSQVDNKEMSSISETPKISVHSTPESTSTMNVSPTSQLESSLQTIEDMIVAKTEDGFETTQLQHSLDILKREMANLKTRQSRVTVPEAVLVSKNHNAPAVVVNHIDNSEYEAQYEVQLGLFRNKQNAEKLTSEIGDKTGLYPYIVIDHKEGKPMYRVVIGSFAGRKLAVNTFRELKNAGYASFVKSL